MTTILLALVAIAIGVFAFFVLGASIAIIFVVGIIAFTIFLILSFFGVISIAGLGLFGLSGGIGAFSVPEDFVKCLWTDKINNCREQYTLMTEQENPSLEALVNDYKSKLGKPLEKINSKYDYESKDGETLVKFEFKRRYEKNPSVLERYVVKKKSDKYAIESFKFEY